MYQLTNSQAIGKPAPHHITCYIRWRLGNGFGEAAVLVIVVEQRD